MRRLGAEGAVGVGVEAVVGGVVDVVVVGGDEVVEGVVVAVGGGFRFCFWIDGMLCVCGEGSLFFFFATFISGLMGGERGDVFLFKRYDIKTFKLWL